MSEQDVQAAEAADALDALSSPTPSEAYRAVRRFGVRPALGAIYSLLSSGGGGGGSQPVLPDLDEAATQPLEGTMKTWATTDAINGTLVHFRTKGIYASLLDNQDFLAFVARSIGAVGNTFSVEYVAPDLDEPLLVTVDGNKITVKLATTGAPVAAGLVTDLGIANAELAYTANAVGAAGNDISVEYDVPVTDSPDTIASASGDAISVALSGTGPVAASVGTGSGNGAIVITATAPGASDNGLAVSVFQQAVGHGFDWDLVGGLRIFLSTLDTSGDLVDWAATNPAHGGHHLHDFVTLTLAPGSDGTGVPVSGGGGGIGPLAGGIDAVSTATADDVKDAIEADTDSNALVAVAHAPGNDGSGVVTAYGPTNLSGGADSGSITTQASDAKTAIEALPEAAALVAVTLEADGTLETMDETNLDGGDDTTVMEGTVAIS